jgi:nicotinate-nucleotide adenylyltransferase
MVMAAQIIIYGGTFDPPHLGHQQCLKLVAAFYPTAKILVVPAKSPPAGRSQIKHPMLSFQDRVKLCRLAFQNDSTGCRNIEVSDLEGNLTPPNYTIATVQAIISLHPDADLSLLIGEDQLKRFPTWHKAKELLSLASLIIVGRESESESSAPVSSLRQAFATLGLTIDLDSSGQAGTIRETGRHLTLLDSSNSKAESSIIRRKLSDGETLPENWISPVVLDYIKSKNLMKEG